MVSYANFCRNIDSAFTIKGIEKAPTYQVAPITAAATEIARKKKLEYDQEEEKCMIDIMEAYRSEIQVRRLNLKPMFQDFDITNCGHVTKK